MNILCKIWKKETDDLFDFETNDIEETELKIEEESERLCSKVSMILIVFVNAWMVTRLFGMVMAV